MESFYCEAVLWLYIKIGCKAEEKRGMCLGFDEWRDEKPNQLVCLRAPTDWELNCWIKWFSMMIYLQQIALFVTV